MGHLYRGGVLKGDDMQQQATGLLFPAGPHLSCHISHEKTQIITIKKFIFRFEKWDPPYNIISSQQRPKHIGLLFCQIITKGSTASDQEVHKHERIQGVHFMQK